VADTLSLAAMRELTDDELRGKITEYERERFGLRFKAGTEVLANPMDLRNTRRTVARLKTVLAERAAKARTA
jgi:large subunit ribosomal protein L29